MSTLSELLSKQLISVLGRVVGGVCHNWIFFAFFHEGFHGFEAAAVEHAFGWERVLNWLEPYARRVNDEERRRQ